MRDLPALVDTTKLLGGLEGHGAPGMPHFALALAELVDVAAPSSRLECVWAGLEEAQPASEVNRQLPGTLPLLSPRPAGFEIFFPADGAMGVAITQRLLRESRGEVLDERGGVGVGGCHAR